MSLTWLRMSGALTVTGNSAWPRTTPDQLHCRFRGPSVNRVWGCCHGGTVSAATEEEDTFGGCEEDQRLWLNRLMRDGRTPVVWLHNWRPRVKLPSESLYCCWNAETLRLMLWTHQHLCLHVKYSIYLRTEWLMNTYVLLLHSNFLQGLEVGHLTSALSWLATVHLISYALWDIFTKTV